MVTRRKKKRLSLCIYYIWADDPAYAAFQHRMSSSARSILARLVAGQGVEAAAERCRARPDMNRRIRRPAARSTASRHYSAMAAHGMQVPTRIAAMAMRLCCNVGFYSTGRNGGARQTRTRPAA